MAKKEDVMDLTDPVHVFEPNDWVSWTSNGKTKIGQVIEVVTAKDDPAVVAGTLPKHTLPSGGFGDPRDHDSYLVSVEQGEGKTPKLYWPVASALKASEPPKDPLNAAVEEKPEKPKKAAKSEPTIPDSEKQKAKSDYEKMLSQVMDLKEMTQTEAWQRNYRWLKMQVKKHADDILDAEKPRDVVRHQEGVKLIKEILESVKGPVEEMNEFISKMPLFSGSFKVRAAWNDDLGIVQLTEV
jgi:hypothetical protein